MLLDGRLRRLGHARIGLGAEILDDDFLDMAVPLVGIANGEQRLDALQPRLADADQNARRERDLRPARGFQRGEADRRHLVGRAMVRAALLRQAVGRRLQHDALADRHGAQPRQPCFVHDAGIEVRQQARFFQDERGHLFQVGQRGVVAQRVQAPRARR